MELSWMAGISKCTRLILRSRGGYTPVMMHGRNGQVLRAYEVSIEEQGWIHYSHDGRHGH